MSDLVGIWFVANNDQVKNDKIGPDMDFWNQLRTSVVKV